MPYTPIDLGAGADTNTGDDTGTAFAKLDAMARELFEQNAAHAAALAAAEETIALLVSGGGAGLPIPPANTTLPQLSGSTALGSTLAVTPGVWTGAPAPTFTYRITRNGTPRAAATGLGALDRSVSAADQGATLAVQEIATNSSGTVVATSATTVVIPGAAPTVTQAATASGTAAVGQVLTGVPAAFSGSPSVVNEWLRGTTVVATTLQYTVVAGDASAVLSFRSTGTNGSGSATSTAATTFSIPGAPTAPGPLQSFAATPTSAYGAQLTGTAPATGGAPTGYQYRYVETAGLSGGALDTALAAAPVVSFASLPTNITGLDAETAHTVEGRAVNGAGNGPWSRATFTTPAAGGSGTYPTLAFSPIKHDFRGTGAPAGSVQRQVVNFHRGHYTAGGPLTWKQADGTVRETQVDTTTACATFWDDGSVRACPVHVKLPLIANGTILEGAFHKEATTVTGTAPNLATRLAAQPVVVEVKNGANVHTMAFADAIPAGRFVNGSLSTEARRKQRLARAVVGGGTDADLIVDVRVDKSGAMMVEARVHNHCAFKPSQGDAVCDIKLTIGGVVKWQRTAETISLYTSVGKEIWVDPAGADLPRNVAYPLFDLQYASRTGIVHNYDRPLGVAESILAGFAAERTGAGWNNPYNPRGIRTDMPGQGDWPHIGPETQSTAAALISADGRAVEHAIDVAEACFGVIWHPWNDDLGQWTTPFERPSAWADTRDSNFLASSNLSTVVPDPPHWGNYATVPYLMTGRRSLLDEVNAQAAYGLLWKWPVERETFAGDEGGVVLSPARTAARLASAVTDGKGVDMRRSSQIRGFAWILRQMLSAFALSPQAETPHGDGWARILQSNFVHLNADKAPNMLVAPQTHGQPLEYEPGNYGQWMAYWQGHFLWNVFVKAARMNAPGDAAGYVLWTTNWHVGAFENIAAKADAMSGWDLQVYDPGVNYRVHANMDVFRDWAGVVVVNSGETYGVNFETGGDPDARVSQASTAVINTAADLLADFGVTHPAMAPVLARLATFSTSKLHITPGELQVAPRWSIVRRGTTRGTVVGLPHAFTAASTGTTDTDSWTGSFTAATTGGTPTGGRFRTSLNGGTTYSAWTDFTGINNVDLVPSGASAGAVVKFQAQAKNGTGYSGPDDGSTGTLTFDRMLAASGGGGLVPFTATNAGVSYAAGFRRLVDSYTGPLFRARLVGNTGGGTNIGQVNKDFDAATLDALLAGAAQFEAQFFGQAPGGTGAFEMHGHWTLCNRSDANWGGRPSFVLNQNSHMTCPTYDFSLPGTAEPGFSAVLRVPSTQWAGAPEPSVFHAHRSGTGTNAQEDYGSFRARIDGSGVLLHERFYADGSSNTAIPRNVPVLLQTISGLAQSQVYVNGAAGTAGNDRTGQSVGPCRVGLGWNFTNADGQDYDSLTATGAEFVVTHTAAQRAAYAANVMASGLV